MRTLLTIFYCLLTLFASANKIDELQTDDEVERFAKKHSRYLSHAYIGTSYLGAQQKTADSLGIKNWYKTDLDGNGLTDIVILYSAVPGISTIITAFLDKGKDYELVLSPTRMNRNLIYPLLTKINSTSAILVYYNSSFYNSSGIISGVDTLVYRSGSFVEYNNNPPKYNIEHITYSTSSCFGTCPAFTMDIDSTGMVTIKEKKLYSDTLLGTYSKNIAPALYDTLVSLLTYLNIEKLKDKYTIPVTDMQGMTLTVTYNGDKVKTIADYPGYGSYGLMLLYNKLYRIRDEVSPVKKLQKAHNRKFFKN